MLSETMLFPFYLDVEKLLICSSRDQTTLFTSRHFRYLGIINCVYYSKVLSFQSRTRLYFEMLSEVEPLA